MSSTRMNRQVIHAARDADAEALLSDPRINRVRVSESLWKGQRASRLIINRECKQLYCNRHSNKFLHGCLEFPTHTPFDICYKMSCQSLETGDGIDD
jgi:hypothetical protein